MRKLIINCGYLFNYPLLDGTMELRVRVGTLEHSIVCSYTNVQNKQIVK